MLTSKEAQEKKTLQQVQTITILEYQAASKNDISSLKEVAVENLSRFDSFKDLYDALERTQADHDIIVHTEAQPGLLAGTEGSPVYFGAGHNEKTKKSEESFNKLKAIWNGTVQGITGLFEPLKEMLKLESILAIKSAFGEFSDSLEQKFESLNDSLEKAVSDYFDKIGEKNDFWSNIKILVGKPLVSLLINLLKDGEKRTTNALDEFFSKESTEYDLEANKEILAKELAKEYENVKYLFSESGNYISAKILEIFGYYGLKHITESAVLESTIIGNDGIAEHHFN